MPFYETVFMSRQELSSAQVEALTDKYKAVVTEMGGKSHKTEQWGLRSLAYRINKSRKAHYTLVEFDATSDAMQEMERQMRIDEDIMRYMTLRIEALTEEPSIMMDKGGDDKKPGRDDRYNNNRDDRKPKREAA